MVKISSFLFLVFVTFSKSYDLKQVLILSRHNIRAPLSSNLQYLSSNTWPIWNVDSAFLTAKGALLEGYMGSFISNWLVKKVCYQQDVLNKTLCMFTLTRGREQRQLQKHL
ncbi:unnamed protein product [Pieris macdunnoughi]|uniref:Glucose-1-phosphatase n=1 Tax=Pieris macdunnoughi TaxID=345717 RepID=A0A821UBJ5_9NEOP|nr:unnamed protein product [Pieris macdunnoughi]